MLSTGGMNVVDASQDCALYQLREEEEEEEESVVGLQITTMKDNKHRCTQFLPRS